MTHYRNSGSVHSRMVRRWTDPFIGAPAPNTTETDRARGDQWKLVLAYAGWETVARERWPGAKHYDCYERVAVDIEGPIPAPVSRSLQRWLTEANLDVADYFSMPRTPTWERLERWLRGDAIDEPSAAMALAWALRNATVHGHLSATKTMEWGLRPAFLTLAELVCRFVES